MKHFFVFSGIILLSLLINRTIHRSSQVTVSADVKLLDDKFITKHDLPAITPTSRGAKAVKNEVSVASAKTVKSVRFATVKKVAIAKTKINNKASFFEEHNNNFRMLHKLIKASGNYTDISTVQFSFNEAATLDSTSFQFIMRVADKLVFDESLKVSIAGFTDNKGSADYNKQLSWLCADNVKKYLVDLGVNENQIMISANGIADPVGDNTTAEGRAENRRVEMVVLK
ncbi:MAG: OmpA family protein [Chitinophagaceae bacterium]|nr:OmpA family protein [Chitinophagaceae bacterium]